MNWLQRKWNWARQKPLFWANVLLLTVTVVVVFFAPSPNGGDVRLRVLAVALQLIGAWTVWRDLTLTARQFGKSDILGSTWGWLKAGFSNRSIVASATGLSMSSATGRARGKARITIDPTASIEKRIINLEYFTEQIDKSIDAAYKEIDGRAAELEGKVKAESAARSAAIADVQRSLESAATGNFAHLAFGAVWLAVGAVLGTLAPEIAHIVAGRGCDVWRVF